jgi:hypothetical protein
LLIDEGFGVGLGAYDDRAPARRSGPSGAAMACPITGSSGTAATGSGSIRSHKPSGEIHGGWSPPHTKIGMGVTQRRELNVSAVSLMVNDGRATEANGLVGPANPVFHEGWEPPSNPTRPMGTFVEFCPTY